MSPRLILAALCLLSIFAFRVDPVDAQAATPTPPPACPVDFDGFLPPRLIPGEAARVLTTPLNFRPAPTTTLARLDQLRPATLVDVTGTPACNEGYVWWPVTVDGVDGWLAEGNPVEETYYLEPRGALITLEGDDGIPRQFVRQDDDRLEPAGCMRPPDDYSRVQLDYATLNRRTVFMLENASRIYRAFGGIYDFRDLLVQGSYNAGVVEASFGTHDGGGAVDLSVRSRADWSVMWGEIPYMIEALRVAGFAAWVRETGELYPNSPIHIHAIAVGDADLSPAARAQIDGERGYLRGYNGLPESYGPPIPDAWGEPVICAWMIADGFPDLRESE
ncbi:MAG: hypothetical protein ACOCXZ_00110 [Chloroflexota bacterium]